MSLKSILGFTLKTMILAFALLVIMIVVSGFAVPMDAAQSSTQDNGSLMLRLLIVNLVHALLLSLVIHQTQWHGWPVILGLAFAFYGVQTVTGQIEAIVFLTPLGENWGAGSVPAFTMPLDFIAGQFIVGAALALFGTLLAAALFRKMPPAKQTDPLFPEMNVGQWLLKLGLVMILYMLLYFGFGYFVAWKSPAIQAFYQGTDPGSFLAQLKHVAAETPTLIPFQAFRALLWTAFTLPVIRMLRHNGWWGALLTGLFVSLPMNIPHIVPNPYMPPDVRLVHFVETVPSTLIFGMLLFWLLHRSHPTAGALFRLPEQKRRLEGAARSPQR